MTDVNATRRCRPCDLAVPTLERPNISQHGSRGSAATTGAVRPLDRATAIKRQPSPDQVAAPSICDRQSDSSWSPATPAWPFVGRAAEQSLIQRLLHDASSQGVVVASAPGVGRSRLINECVVTAENTGSLVLRFHASRAAAAVPFGVFGSLLPDELSVNESPNGVQTALLARLVSLAAGEAGRGRLVILIDDAHLLDDASAALVQLIATVSSAFVVVSVCAADVAPDAIVGLWKNDTLTRVELEPLSLDEVEQLVACVLGGPVQRACVNDLWHRCNGSVLFLCEWVRASIEAGANELHDGIWTLSTRTAPSQRLIDLVETRLRDLADDERDLLEMLAFGEPMGSGDVTFVSDLSTALRLEARGLLLSRLHRGQLEIVIAEPMVGEVLRVQVSPLRRRTIAATVAEAIEQTGALGQGDALRIAMLRLESGDAKPRILASAATEAMRRREFMLGERLARAAIEAGSGFSTSMLLAELIGSQGRAGEAEQQLSDLIAVAANDDERADVAIRRLANNILHRGHFDQEQRLEAEHIRTDDRRRTEIMARAAIVELGTNGPRACAKAVEPLLNGATGSALVWACIGGAYSLGRLGYADRAIQVASRGFDAHANLVEPIEWDPCLHVYLRCQALAYSGRIREGRELARSEYERSRLAGNSEAQAYYAMFLGQLVAGLGHAQSAVEFERESVALFRQLGRPTQTEQALAHLVVAYSVGGDGPSARQALSDLEGLGLPTGRHRILDVHLAHAWASCAEGDLKTAQQHLSEAIKAGSVVGDRIGESTALHTLARFGRPDAARHRLAILAEEIDGCVAPTQLAHVEALAGRDAARLEQVATDFETMGLSLFAAEAAADAAVIWRQSGFARQSSAAARRSRSLMQLCPGATSPALQGVETRSLLTPAERNVLLLAARGQTNRAIAETLVVSVRTIENHLQHAYEKLGIHGRSAISEALLGQVPGTCQSIEQCRARMINERQASL
jgi:DNA-binding CsgD family transcriptional regulator